MEPARHPFPVSSTAPHYRRTKSESQEVLFVVNHFSVSALIVRGLTTGSLPLRGRTRQTGWLAHQEPRRHCRPKQPRLHGKIRRLPTASRIWTPVKRRPSPGKWFDQGFPPNLRMAGKKSGAEKFPFASFRQAAGNEESVFSRMFCKKQIPRFTRDDSKRTFRQRVRTRDPAGRTICGGRSRRRCRR
jgi:hypothetical protein